LLHAQSFSVLPRSGMTHHVRHDEPLSLVHSFLYGRIFAQWLQYMEQIREEEEEERRRQGQGTLHAPQILLLCRVLLSLEPGVLLPLPGQVRPPSHSSFNAPLFSPSHFFCRTIPLLWVASGVLERVVKRMINSALSTGFLIWLENVNEIQIQRAEEAQQAVDAAKKALEEELNSRTHQASDSSLWQLPAGAHLFLAQTSTGLPFSSGKSAHRSRNRRLASQGELLLLGATVCLSLGSTTDICVANLNLNWMQERAATLEADLANAKKALEDERLAAAEKGSASDSKACIIS